MNSSTILDVNDKKLYRVKKDYMGPVFGTGSYRHAKWPENSNLEIKSADSSIPSTWFVWSGKGYNNTSGRLNKLLKNDSVLVECTDLNYFYDEEPVSKLRCAVRLVFMELTPKSGWRFYGAYIPDFANSKMRDDKYKYENHFIRIATKVKVNSIDDVASSIELLDFVSHRKYVCIPENSAEDIEYVEYVAVESHDEETEDLYVPEREDAPKPITGKSKEKYPRNKIKAITALARAGYKCEFNQKHESFISASNGKPYMEVHHLVPMAQQSKFEYSLDTPANIVSLCSNCHRCIHLGKKRNVLLKALYDKRKEELKKTGIKITFEDLLNMYN